MSREAEPTPELGKHHDLVKPSRATANGTWVIRSRVDSLRSDRKIGDADVAACVRFHRDWDIGVEGVSAGNGMGGRVDCETGGSDLDSAVDALSRLRAVTVSIGPTAVLLLEMCVVLDLSWTVMASRLSVSDKTAKERTIKEIQLLTDHYSKMDNARKKSR